MYRVSNAIYRAMKEAGLNNRQLAERVGKKPAYITRVFKGDHNMTVKTMAALAFSMGKKVHITLRNDDDARLDWVTYPDKVVQFPQGGKQQRQVFEQDYQHNVCRHG